VRAHAGKLYVAARALTDYWEVYKTNFPRERATAKAVVGALRTLGASDRVDLAVPGFSHRQKLYVISPEDLARFAEGAYADTEELTAALTKIEEADRVAEEAETNRIIAVHPLHYGPS
jgi:hypothetical protein